MQHHAQLAIVLLLTACGGADEPADGPPSARDAPTDPAPVDEDAPGPTGEPAAEEPGESATEESDAARARAVQTAEEFVRAQGYTDTPPTVSGDEVVHEGIEGYIEMRRNSLRPRAARARQQGQVWSVIFGYVDPQYSERSRMLVLRPGEPPRFVRCSSGPGATSSRTSDGSCP